mgnify:CR=1 FL=1
MTPEQYTDYLREMEESNLLPQIYNGWRILMDKEQQMNVTLGLVLKDNEFVQCNKVLMEKEYNLGI